jgi:hypothetical protein
MRGGFHPGPEAILYTRASCPLCFVMRRAAARAARRHGLGLRIVDIGGDAGLEARYGDAVPVLVLPAMTFSGRADARAIEAAFRAARGPVAPAGARLAAALRRALDGLRRRPRGGGPLP